MRKLIFCLLLVIHFLTATTQNSISPRASQLHIEFLGPGSLYSINFDSRFAKKVTGLGYRIGLGGSPLGVLGKSCNEGALLTLPLGLTYLAGKTNHLFELGAGGVAGIITSATKVYCFDFDSDFFSDETGNYGYISAGYRYQPVSKKGLTYRIFLSPLFQPDFAPKLWGCASLGYRW